MYFKKEVGDVHSGAGSMARRNIRFVRYGLSEGKAQRQCLRASLVLLVASATASLSAVSAVVDEAEMERLFTLKVKPILSEKCYGCHGGPGKKVKGGLKLTTLEDFLKGGEFFDDVLIPGDAENSFVMGAVRWKDPDFEMPPKENDRLSEVQIADLEKWINAGAHWPDEERQNEIRIAERKVRENEEGILIEHSGGLADEWTYRRYKPEDMWAFMPIRKPAVPEVPTRTGNPIDSFVVAKLQEAGYEPAPQADPITLIRRASFDVTGLPPSPEEVADFKREFKQNPDYAWTELVDRLLESDHYGERWGQHWLDVARYSDTGGMSNDYERSNAWRYRDYVIRSFNEDKPYNEFVIEQVAGDELVANSVEDRLDGDEEAISKIHGTGAYTPQETEWMVASSFLRMGPWDSAMVAKPEARQIYIDDIVNSVGQTFLSTTMRCLKCHDHKFDPLPTKDYYRLYSAFSATQLAERPAAFHPKENLNGLEEGKAMVEKLHAFAAEKKEALHEKREAAAKTWFTERGLEYIDHASRKALDDDVKPPRDIGLDFIDEGRLKVREQDDWIWERRKERYQPMVQSVFNSHLPKSVNARKLRVTDKIDENETTESFILMGGSLKAPGERVSPGVLSALGVPVDPASDDPYVIPEDLDGRRLAVARWIADARNPLTSRSYVNRIWQHHFGKPLAANPNNFGAKGEKPTHPDLIDWLAAEFVDGGWKIKRMHKLIMLSDTYKQSTIHPARGELETDDPSNDLLASYPPRRLTAEEIRDGMLKITGELNTEVGGLPVMPEINMEVALQPRMIQFSIAPAHQPFPEPEQRNRRSVYAYRVRGQADPFLEIFNQPNPNDSCEIRDDASVSPQAFTLLNSDVVTDRSIAFADRLIREEKSFSKRVSRAFELALSRSPTKQEQMRMLDYLENMRDYHKEHEPVPVTYPTKITRSLVEEFSGKPFEYEEILPAFEGYVPDKKAADVDADTRALADLCLVLFNTNEFVHVY